MACGLSDFASNIEDGLAEFVIRASRLWRLLRPNLLELQFTVSCQDDQSQSLPEWASHQAERVRSEAY